MTKQLIFFSPYWWPTIYEDIKYHIEYECEECMLDTNTKQKETNKKEEMAKTLRGESPINWRSPYIDYLIFGKIINDKLTQKEHERIANWTQFFTIEVGNY